MADPLEDRTLCGRCGAELDEPSTTPPGARVPCPACGSTSRRFTKHLAATVKLESSFDAYIVRAWDGNSLTLFGVLYGILITVLGVAIAVVFAPWVAVVYAVASIICLAVGLLYFGQPLIAAMRWIVERGKRPPPFAKGR